jgi:hypothetical protein
MKTHRFDPVIPVFVFLAVLATLPFLNDTLAAQEAPDFYYREVRTDDMRLVYYDEAHDYIVPHMTRCFENSLRFHKKLFDYEPSEEVTIHLQDFDDYGYAGTTTIPYNYITLGLEPFEYVFDTCPTNERMNWVTSHELVHVVACDQAAGSDRFFRTIFFGKVAPTDEDPVSIIYSFFTNPRYYSPRWYHEGIAVFLETWMAGGIGRAQSGYDEMVFRTMVRDKTRFYDIVGLESEGTTIDFQTGRMSYLYGTRFVSYLAHIYGPDKVIEWFQRGSHSKRYFSSQFKNVYGVPVDEAWRDWVRWEHEWQSANLDSIRKFPLTSYRALSERPLGSISRQYYVPEEEKLYAAVQYPGEYAHIAELDIATGKTRKLCDIATPATYYVTHLAFDPEGRRLFYTTHNSRGWRHINVLDIETGKTDIVGRNVRTGDLVYNRADGSLWGIQHHGGKSRLVRFQEPYDRWQEIMILPYGKDIFDLDISPDGRSLTASMIEVTGRQRLIRMEIEKLLGWDTSYEVLWEFADNAPANFTYSPDGRYLYGTSFYTGISNVFRYDFENQTMDAVSNCETGLFRPIAAENDSLIAIHYAGDGFVPVKIPGRPIEDVSPVRYLGTAVAMEYPAVRDLMLGSPAAIDADSLIISKGRYSGLGNVGLASAYPISESYKDSPTVGLRMNFVDPVMLHGLNVAVSYSPTDELPEDERLHARFEYRHNRMTLNGAYNRADFYDYFGPTKTSRKGYSLGLNYTGKLIDDTPLSLGYGLGVSGYWGLERMPLWQNIATTYDNFMVANAQMSFSRLGSTIGAIEAEKGFMWTLSGSGTYVREEIYPQIRSNMTFGMPTPIDHSSLWLHTSLGNSFGDREDSFANFYFGGFGNNWIDHRGANRYRQYHSFPGVELNSIAGRNYAKAMVEWTLPPLRFKRMGLPWLYANWARLSLFTSGIVTNWDYDPWRREVANAGAQLNVQLVLFSSLSSTFSAGYAHAMEGEWDEDGEFMVSLKILR